jgi:hypothetical protein
VASLVNFIGIDKNSVPGTGRATFSYKLARAE